MKNVIYNYCKYIQIFFQTCCLIPRLFITHKYLMFIPLSFINFLNRIYVFMYLRIILIHTSNLVKTHKFIYY